jgi:hypothetical protein
MKKKLTCCIAAALFLANYCFCQDKVERYCELVESHFHKISIDFGSRDLYIQDSAMAKSLMDIPRCKNTTDALNYMSELGWKLVTTSIWANPSYKVFYLKKEFDKSVLAATKSTP